MDLSRETLTPASEAEWLEMRTKDITSTEAAALFGASPYATEFELYHRKIGQLDDDFEDNDRTKWGRRLETAIAEGVAEDLGLVVVPFKEYMRIPELRLGSSFDFKIVGLRNDWNGDDETYRDLFREHGPGIMEVKNVDGMAFRRSWMDDGEVEAPAHIEFQVQHQLEVADLGWSVVAPLINGNTPRPFFRIRDTRVGEAIKEKAAAMWLRIDTENPPPPNFEEDGDAIARLLVNSNGEAVDMRENNHLAVLCAEYKAAGTEESEAKKRKDAIKAEILTIIGEYAKVTAAGFTISAGTVNANPGKLITEAMLGQRVGERRAYRSMRITAKKA